MMHTANHLDLVQSSVLSKALLYVTTSRCLEAFDHIPIRGESMPCTQRRATHQQQTRILKTLFLICCFQTKMCEKGYVKRQQKYMQPDITRKIPSGVDRAVRTRWKWTCVLLVRDIYCSIYHGEGLISVGITSLL